MGIQTDAPLGAAMMTHDGLLATLGKVKDFTRADAQALWEANCDTSDGCFNSLWTLWTKNKRIVKTTQIENTHAWRWRKSKQRKRIEQFRNDAANKEAKHHFPRGAILGFYCPMLDGKKKLEAQ